MIHIDQLEFAYPGEEFRLSVPAFHVAAGEKVALTGPSGSGKSTLLSLIAGVLRPTSGQIKVADREVANLSNRESRAFRAQSIGFVFQDFGLLDYLSARDNIFHPYRMCAPLNLDTHVRARADELATKLGVSAQLHRRPGELSQGERQRVAICRALLPEPPVLLADEATGTADFCTESSGTRVEFGEGLAMIEGIHVLVRAICVERIQDKAVENCIA